MKNMMRKNLLIITIMVISSTFSRLQAQTILPTISLSSDDGGLTNGGEWQSSSLKDKVNLLLYVDPDKHSDVKLLVAKLDSINYSPDSLGITFIVNTGATIIPNFIIRNRMKKRAESSPNITYVLDQKKVLVKNWDLIDDNLNILLIDASGKITEKHHGKMTEKFINQFLNNIDNLIKKEK